MSKTLTRKPWFRDPDSKDASRSVVLALQGNSECFMHSVVESKFLELVQPVEDDMQAQCLPVSKSDYPKWMHQKIPKVSSLRNFSKVPTWCRKPQTFTYHWQQWDSSASRRDRSYQWSVPTSKDLTGSDYDTDGEWHKSRMKYSSGWANDPSWSQS